MAELVSKGPEIKVPALRGINLRKAKSQLDSGEFDRLQGVYPLHNGSLTRMPGKQLWRVFENGTIPEEVFQVYQTFDGTGNVIIQNGDSISVYTVDELRNRQTTFSLTPTSSPAESILGNSQTSGSYGGNLVSDNTFSPTNVTIQSDAPGYIISCASNVFTLALGTYRIRARILFGSSPSRDVVYARAGLYNVTNGQFQAYTGTGVEILSTSGRLPKGNGSTAYKNGAVWLTGRFSVTAASENFSIRMAASSTPAGTSNGSEAQGAPSLVTSGSKPEIYSLITITRE